MPAPVARCRLATSCRSCSTHFTLFGKHCSRIRQRSDATSMKRRDPSSPFWWRGAIERGDATFLVGAGISADPPSSFPLAAGLTRELLAPVTAAANVPSTMARRCERIASTLRPEVAAELLIDHLGFDVVFSPRAESRSRLGVLNPARGRTHEEVPLQC